MIFLMQTAHFSQRLHIAFAHEIVSWNFFSLKKIYSRSLIPNYTQNHVIAYTVQWKLNAL